MFKVLLHLADQKRLHIQRWLFQILIWHEVQRWRWPLATSPNAKIFAMWGKICDVFSHSGEDKNKMPPQYL